MSATKLSRSERESVWLKSAFGYDRHLEHSKTHDFQAQTFEGDQAQRMTWQALLLEVGSERAQNISRKNFDALAKECAANYKTQHALYGSSIAYCRCGEWTRSRFEGHPFCGPCIDWYSRWAMSLDELSLPRHITPPQPVSV